MVRMIVYVRLFGQLRKYHPGPNRSQPLRLELKDGATAAAVISTLELPGTLVRAPFINDVQGQADTRLHDGDRISLFSPVVGGDKAAVCPYTATADRFNR